MESRITKISLAERKKTFKEVSLGFSEEQVLIEAKRCLQCVNAPCIKGCHAGIDIKEFIRFIKEKNYQAAIDKIKEDNNLPGVCGRVCPQEEQCQLTCILNAKDRPIKIGYLERFAADWELIDEGRKTKDEGRGNSSFVRHPSSFVKKVAVIGSGPAGLSCAAYLAKQGIKVFLYEALHKPGGVLVYGIPEFRLPKIIVNKEVEFIKSLGVEVMLDSVIGRVKTIDDLRKEGISAFFIGVGAGAPKFLNIPGENLNGVYSANEFLTRVNLMKAYRFPEYDTPVKVGAKIGVVGAGNVSFDCARSGLRLGAKEVMIIYRRSREEMPARQEEIENALEEGVKFNLLVSPQRILDNGRGGLKVVCLRNELSVPDSSGRRKPVPIQGSDFTIELDTLIIAVGTEPNPLLISSISGLKINTRGYIEINEKYQTSIRDIFAGGDIVTGSATVISAINQAKLAAEAIKDYLTKVSLI